jgi:signal transduction histidine kinase
VAYGSAMRVRAVDIGWVAAVAAAMTLTISVAEEEGATRSVDVLAYAIGLGVAALLFARRRHPLGVVVATIALLMAYYSLNYPAFSPAVPLAAAAYFAALSGRLVGAAAVLGVFMGYASIYQVFDEDDSLFSVLGTHVLGEMALLAAVLLLGEAVRTRRALAAEVRARLARADADREREAERRVQEERLRIARELHDVMAHTIAGIGVQAGVAGDVIDDAPEQAKSSLAAIREQTRDAMAELRAAVGLLRDGAPHAPRAPAPGLHALEGLVGTAGRGGLDVDVSVAGDVRPLPAAVDLTAYRIVQESLTNVVRHAHASMARVAVRYESDAVVLEIADDGHGAAARDDAARAGGKAVAQRNGASEPGDGIAAKRNGAGEPGDGTAARDNGAGHGLVGMRERVAAVGGTLEAGPAPGGGFRVAARLPTRRVSS